MADTDPATRLAEVATTLYGLPPADFIAARGAQVKAAKQAGEAEAASLIGGWRRPTVSAWLVNSLVRDRADLVHDLLDLGERLRAAQQALDGAQLRALTKERQQQVAGLTRAAAELAKESGAALTDATSRELEGTFLAALGDPEAAAAVESGHLVTALSAAGFGPTELAAAVAVPHRAVPHRAVPHRAVPHRSVPDSAGPTRAERSPRAGQTPSRPTPPKVDPDAIRKAELAAAQKASEGAEQARVEAADAAQDAAKELADARERATRAQSALVAAERAAQAARRALDRAERRAGRGAGAGTAE